MVAILDMAVNLKKNNKITNNKGLPRQHLWKVWTINMLFLLLGLKFSIVLVCQVTQYETGLLLELA